MLVNNELNKRDYPCGADHPRWKGGKIEVLCAHCGEKIFRKKSKVKKNKNHFCNRKCMGAWQSANKCGEKHPTYKGGYTQIFCVQCNEKVFRRPSMIEEGKNYFCSRECASAWRVSNFCGENNSHWKGGLPTFICDQCGKEFERKPSQVAIAKNNFCSIKCSGLWKSDNLSGENSHLWNGGAARVVCCQCGKEFEKTYASIRQSKKHFCSYNCKYIWQSINQCGENNPMWNGGISLGDYCPTWKDSEFKSYILERDGHRCQNPDCWGTSKRLARHHINYNKKDCKLENLICLCTSCNSRANVDRAWHTAYYQAIMDKRFNIRSIINEYSTENNIKGVEIWKENKAHSPALHF